MRLKKKRIHKISSFIRKSIFGACSMRVFLFSIILVLSLSVFFFSGLNNILLINNNQDNTFYDLMESECQVVESVCVIIAESTIEILVNSLVVLLIEIALVFKGLIKLYKFIQSVEICRTKVSTCGIHVFSFMKSSFSFIVSTALSFRIEYMHWFAVATNAMFYNYCLK